MQPAGRNGKSALDLLEDSARGVRSRIALQAILEAKLAAVLPDEVDDGEMALAVARAGGRGRAAG